MATSLPNILFIFSDQHSAHTMSCAGDPNIDTPNLDRLAHEGIRFTNAYANTPLCSPFRACLYTGQYITTHGVTSLHRPLLPRQPELAEVLLRHGYHTSHMGKWHLSGGAAPSHFVSPYFRPGWQSWRGWENSNEPFATKYAEGDLPQPLCTMQGYQTDVLTDWTLEFLAENRDAGPWFHVVSIEPPHPPNQAPEAFTRLFTERELALRLNVPCEHPRLSAFVDHLRHYYAQIANLDWNLGRILDQLEATGQREQTMVWYFSDHGDFMGSHGKMQKSRPEEESSKIPLLVRWPERVPADSVSQGLISAVDIMPTLLGSLGLPIPNSVEGEDLSRCLTDSAAAGAESILLQYEATFFPSTPEQIYRGLRQGPWKLAQWLSPDRDQLYNLDDDPFEMNNRINDPDCHDIQETLTSLLTTRMKIIGDDFMERRQFR
jgi:arylsulfatase A-like enzyme